MRTIALALASVVAAGCGGGRGTSSADLSPDAVTPPMVPRRADDHPPLWKIVSYGGPVQVSPQIYTVVWPGAETLGQEIERFVGWMLHSDYWTGTLAEYGVGAGDSRGLVVLSTPAPATLDEDGLRVIIEQLIAAGTVAADNNAQVLFLLQPQTLATLDGHQSCSYFVGTHGSVTVGTHVITWDVAADCGTSPTTFDDLTKTVSHEAAEAATDPTPNTSLSAEAPVRQEIGDLCNFDANVPIDVPGDAQTPPTRYWVQRQYSGRIATLGTQDPCVPSPWNRPFWGVAVYPRVVPAPVATHAVTVPAWIEPFAYGDVGLIKWIAVPQETGIHIAPSSGEARAGDTIAVSITLDDPHRADVHEIDVWAQSQRAGSNWWYSYVSVK
jgi:hypothetical protein